MTKETNNNEAQATEEMLNIKVWPLAGVFTVTLLAVLAAIFFYLEDLTAELLVLLLFITISSIMLTGFYFLEKTKNKKQLGAPK